MHQVTGDTIRGIPIFSGLTPIHAAELSRSCGVIRLGASESLFSEGDPAGHLYIVLSGSLRITCLGIDGIPVVVGTVDPGDVVGEMGVIDTSPRSATATAIDEVEVLCLAGDVFGDLIDAGHPAAASILEELRNRLCARMRMLDERIDAVFFLPEDTEEFEPDLTMGDRIRGLIRVLVGGGADR